MDNSIRDDTLLAPFIVFFFILIADILPIASQLITMMVTMDAKDSGRRDTEYDGGHMYEGSEYYNAVLHAVSSSGTGSFLSEQEEPKKQLMINGSREFSGGINFLAKQASNNSGNHNSSDDSDHE